MSNNTDEKCLCGQSNEGRPRMDIVCPVHDPLEFHIRQAAETAKLEQHQLLYGNTKIFGHRTGRGKKARWMRREARRTGGVYITANKFVQQQT